MISPLSLSNILTVLLAGLCLWTIVPQARGGVVKLWRLAMPACLATVQALVLLAGVFEVSLVSDAEWLAAGIVGALLGRIRGWSLPVEFDRARDLVRLRPSMDGHLAALGLVVLAAIDFISAYHEEAVLPPDMVAAGAAFFAGYIGCRAIAVGVRARSNRVSALPTPAETSLPPS